ncbi:gamma-glutamylcyclotransferase [Pseudomonas knackmussii]|uniref:Gamma-glutamylcyclotransferase n=1 Tax=Pseudomonas knackmussii TaxID=65741 RepID=A0ABY4KJX9_9PSED|nr:gamma-glutamylcyclotransferase family protein [Pseudomonas knackmussii]UPQ80989.1 gamma-glutamylcyclotransferase [Pseudomonas knackmussii]
MERLFVYGSLAPGRPNEHILAGVAGSWEAASVTGTLREEGWGAAMGFPGLDLNEQGERIEGFVFSSNQLPAQWAALDAFEGDAYIRTPAAVRLGTGQTVEAYVYALRK